MTILGKSDARVFAYALDDAAEHFSSISSLVPRRVSQVEKVLRDRPEGEHLAFKSVHAPLLFDIHTESSVSPRTMDGRARAGGESILAGARNASTSTERARV
jgi:hypothetical protein